MGCRKQRIGFKSSREVHTHTHTYIYIYIYIYYTYHLLGFLSCKKKKKEKKEQFVTSTCHSTVYQTNKRTIVFTVVRFIINKISQEKKKKKK